MKNRSLLFPGTVSMFGLFLTLLSLSLKAGEISLPFQYTAVFTASNNPTVTSRILPKDYSTANTAEHASDLTLVNDKSVLLTPSAGSERTKALTDANEDKCLRDYSQAITSEVHVQHEVALPAFSGAEATGALHSASDASSAPIHFELADSLIYMQASINGSQPLWMMLDTGSSVTVFDETVSKMLGIRFLVGGKVDGPGQGSSQTLAFASHTTLMFAGEELGDQTVATLPLEWFSREVGRNTDGFLGSNIFRNYVVEIDYANQLLRLHDPASYAYSGSGQRLTLEFIWNDIPTVRAEVLMQDGTAIMGTFLVDSGATTALWLTKDFSEAHPEFLSAQETIELPSVVAVGGEVSTRLGRVAAVRLGGFLVFTPLTQFSQNTSGIFAAPEVAGTIGAQTLRRFTVIFDYAHGEMILEPNEHFGDPSE
jgi:hypothetical protein